MSPPSAIRPVRMIRTSPLKRMSRLVPPVWTGPADRAGRAGPLGRTNWTSPRDAVLAGVFLIAMSVDRIEAADGLHTGLPLALALSAVAAGALAVRRTLPLAGYLVGSAALSAEALFVLPSAVSPYANLVGLYSIGLYATRRRAWFGPFAALLGMAAYFADLAHTYPVIPTGVLFLWLLGWAVGYGTARRVEERGAARLRLRQQVVAEERARLARELHDLVGHTLNVLLIQAGAARRLLDREPERTRELLSGMEHSGREALDDLDRVLGLLRRGAEAPGGPALQPGLADLDRLTGRLEQAGLRVSVRVDRGADRVPRSLDVSAYRIVQEALTNTVKHARARTASVTVRCTGGSLDIEVSDDGRGSDAGYTPGRGLLGIAERVSMLGGSVEHERGEQGGFRLRAVLPIP
ncbi:sensor histidine kinase [Kitasatospora sp. NPDC058406]|uniref:sensor histidine kinase n=1 Tax=Kitasatospora sp. NPDC058406 TaxID=3346483 RepID=UPI003667903D